MKRLLLLTILLSALVVVATTSPPAYAKGATDVVVSGPGIDDVALTYTRRADDVDVGSMAEASGVYLIYGAAQVAQRPALTAAQLGERYTLTWYQGRTVMIVMHVYPFAEGGAWSYLPDEQAGWVRGGRDLERAMVELGAERPPVDSEPEVSTGSTAVWSGSRTDVEHVGSATSTVSVAGQAWLGGLVALAVVAGAGWLLLRRRRTDDGRRDHAHG